MEFHKGMKRLTNTHTYVARLAKAALIDGEAWAMKEIAERLEGKAMQAIEVGGPGGGPIEQQVVFKRAANPNDSDDDCDANN